MKAGGYECKGSVKNPSADLRFREGKVAKFIAKDAGVSPRVVEQFMYIEKHADEKLVNDLCEGKLVTDEMGKNRKLSVDGVYVDIKRSKAKANIISSLESIGAKGAKATQGVYDVVVINPPWEITKIKLDVRPNQAENLDYPTMSVDEYSVMLWMINNQLGRRNLTDAAKIRYALLGEDLEKKRAERRMNLGKSDPRADLPQGKVRDIIAKKAGVGAKAVDKFKFIQENAPEVADALCRGNETVDGRKLSIDGVYRDLRKEERQKTLKTTEFPKGKYRVIYADPLGRLFPAAFLLLRSYTRGPWLFFLTKLTFLNNFLG
jgi:hypothetical protein